MSGSRHTLPRSRRRTSTGPSATTPTWPISPTSAPLTSPPQSSSAMRRSPPLTTSGRQRWPTLSRAARRTPWPRSRGGRLTSPRPWRGARRRSPQQPPSGGPRSPRLSLNAGPRLPPRSPSAEPAYPARSERPTSPISARRSPMKHRRPVRTICACPWPSNRPTPYSEPSEHYGRSGSERPPSKSNRPNSSEPNSSPVGTQPIRPPPTNVRPRWRRQRRPLWGPCAQPVDRAACKSSGGRSDPRQHHCNVRITPSSQPGRPASHAGTGWRSDSTSAANSSASIDSSCA